MNSNQLENILKAAVTTQLVFDNGDTLDIGVADVGVEGDLISIYPRIRERQYRILYSSATLDKHGTATPQELVTYWQNNGFFLPSVGVGLYDNVEFRGDLPVTVGTPAIGTIFLVEKPTVVFGIYTTHQSGLYIKENDTGSLSNWRRLNIKPKFTDSEFTLVQSADPEIQLKMSLSNLTAPMRVVTFQDKDYTLADAADVINTEQKNIIIGHVTAESSSVLNVNVVTPVQIPITGIKGKNGLVYTLAGGSLVIPVSGYYKVSYKFNVRTVSNQRSDIGGIIRINGVDEIGTVGTNYNSRNNANPVGSTQIASVSIDSSLTAGDLVSLHSFRAGTQTQAVTIDANETIITLDYLGI